MAPTLLITGATGFLGRFLVRELLRKRQNADLVLLTRAPDSKIAQERCHSLLIGSEFAGSQANQRVQAVVGDVTQPRLGLAPTEYEDLLGRVNDVFHCAARLDFGMSRSRAERVNVTGTARVLEFARDTHRGGRSVHVHHISSVFVAGRRRGAFHEADAAETGRFFNEYERSKAVAEQLVVAASSTIPVTIFRPSQIVGDSRTGEVVNPGLLYRVIEMALRGTQLTLPRCEGASFDLLPVDYVATAIEYLSRQPSSAGSAYHLVAGRENAVPISEFVELLWQAANRLSQKEGAESPPQPTWMDPRWLRLGARLARITSKGRRFARFAQPALDYMTLERVYDDREARAILHPAGLRAPRFQDYVSNLLSPLVSGTGLISRAGGRAE